MTGEHLLGELSAISEMAQRVEKAARLHRATGHLDTSYLTALEDMTLALGAMLKARREKDPKGLPRQGAEQFDQTQ
jgi:hypothetical protein